MSIVSSEANFEGIAPAAELKDSPAAGRANLAPSIDSEADPVIV